MPINGPASLAAYHQRELDKERKPMATATSFDTEKMDPETAVVASARVASILNQQPATASSPTPISQSTDTAAPKKTRTTVASLLKKYQEREKELDTDIMKNSVIIASYEKRGEEFKFKKSVLQELIAEINADTD